MDKETDSRETDKQRRDMDKEIDSEKHKYRDTDK